MTEIAKPPFIIRRIIRSVGCREDHQCPTGFFCEVTRLSCRECLNCKEFNRLNLQQQNVTSCVTSVTACGACFAGLVSGQADNKCVPPPVGQHVLLPYEWAVITVGLLLAFVICVVAVYVLRNFDTFKILASTVTSVPPPVDVEASAPHLPPSYGDVAVLPPSYNNVTALPVANQCRNDDERAPFIKPIPSRRPSEARESAGRQAARVFNNPTYDRTLQLPSDDSPNIQAVLPTVPETSTDINSNEDPTNSANTAATHSEESNANQMQIARTPSTKLLQASQESNNNSSGPDGRDGSFAQCGAAFIINVIKNVNSVQQRNEIS